MRGLKKPRDWTRYGNCPSCGVTRGYACLKLSVPRDQFFIPEDSRMMHPHKDREQLFRKKSK